MPRYTYRSPAKPPAGNRAAAQPAFARGVQAQRDGRLNDAIQSYLEAVRLDPAFFDAFYNWGVAAHDLQRYQQSLAAYETALAIEPTSTTARYNFALTLRDAGYWLDAVDQLNKLLAEAPGDVRAHLALADLYAQKLRQPQSARPHYLRVLALQPQSPDATAIRYWLRNNPE